MTQLLSPTLREVPAEAEVISHQLFLRAGYIRRVSNGVYTYMPLMWRVIKKIEAIIRDEMDKADAQELRLPIIQPEALWEESGRWGVYGPLMMRIKDRHDRHYGLAPTAEEVITDLARKEIRSYRQLPMHLYQIQNKYRDETRPRFGLLRGREFIMKDSYSFHASEDCLIAEYEKMAGVYTAIFERCGLETRMVRSDSGSIGGSVSHEFMVLTQPTESGQESGENDVFFCDQCDYAANAEHAVSVCPPANRESPYNSGFQVIETPNTSAIEDLEAQYNLPSETILKSLLYMVTDSATALKPVLALIRGDLSIEPVKLMNACQGHEIRLASDAEIQAVLKTVKGFIGPYQLPCQLEESADTALQVIADPSVLLLKNFTMAVNQVDQHAVGVNWGDAGVLVLRDDQCVDIRLARVADRCAICDSGKLLMKRGIEVGNIFQLGTRYTAVMQATFTTENGSETPLIMGTYGIGVSRTAAAAIECYHDGYGMIWPMAIAPFQVTVVVVNPQDEAQWALGQTVYAQLKAAGIDVLLDDRNERAGVKFKDADLIGIPIRVTAGKKAGEGLLEFKLRDAKTADNKTVSEILEAVTHAIDHWKPSLTQLVSY